MKIVERVLKQKRLRDIVNLDELQFGFFPGKGRVNAIFLLNRVKKEFRKKKSLYMCFVDLEKAFDKVPRKVVELAMRKKYQR